MRSKMRSKSRTKSKSKSRSKSRTKVSSNASKYWNLSKIVEQPAPKLNALGVIIDATGAYKTFDSTDYVTKLKVVDSTFNFKTKKSSYKRYVHVFIYTATASEGPRVNRVGDIIRLKNFDFRTYQNSEVKGVLVKGQSEWAIYDGRKNANLNSISRSSTYSTSLNASDKKKVTELRNWSTKFFKKNSIKEMNWFKRETDVNQADNTVIEIKDVDMIVKLLNDVTYVVDDQIYHKLAFVDTEKNIYYAEYAGHFDNIDEGDVCKLRSISLVIATESRKITFSNYSAILQLVKDTADAKALIAATKGVKVKTQDLDNQEFQELHLDKMQKTQIGLNTFAFTSEDGVNPTNLKNNMVKGYPVLENFDHKKEDFLYENNFGFRFFSKRGSAVLKKYSNQNYYTFKELFNIQDEILMKPEAAAKYQHQKFLVRGFILATEYDYIFNTAKLYSPSLNKVWDFDLHEKAQAQADDLQVILHNVFYMKDSSIETEQKCFPVYLITFDGNPQYSFDLWKTLPDYLDLNKWFNLKESKVTKFTELMENLKAPQFFYDMVVQLMVNNQGKVYFRMVDTIFWFNN